MESKNTRIPNTINAYVCPNLHTMVTKDLDKGVTPMFHSCPKCGERATSMMYEVNQDLAPEYGWYKPTEEDIIKEVKDFAAAEKIKVADILPRFKEYYAKGGLAFKKL